MTYNENNFMVIASYASVCVCLSSLAVGDSFLVVR